METSLTKVEFEKQFLNLVYKTDVLITAPNVAYHLNLPIEEVQDHLLTLELNGVIQQESDDQGNTHYIMPNRPDPGTLPARLEQGEGGEQGAAPGTYNPADLQSAPIYNKPGAKGKNVNGLVLNVIFPGVGSLVCGKMTGLAMIGLLLLGLLMFIFVDSWLGKAAGVLPIAAGWIWSIVAGVGLLNETEDRRRR